MKIGIVAEGSYPYVSGGVSSWIHMLIESMPQHKFEIIAISDKARKKSDYKYSLPFNVCGITNINLNEVSTRLVRKPQLLKNEQEKIREWLASNSFREDVLMLLGDRRKVGTSEQFLNSPLFWSFIVDTYQKQYNNSSFLDFYSMWKSMLSPVLSLLQQDYPKVDIIHSVSTGYAGLVSSYIKATQQIPFILTEHGMYSREREEEILKSNWVKDDFKETWIQFFYYLSKIAYYHAEDIITLFKRNSQFQELSGAPREKLKIIPNGVHYHKYAAIKREKPDRKLRIGAIVRVVPIKDIKTMIQAAKYLKEDNIPIQLFIMGPVEEDEEYTLECEQLIVTLGLEEEVVITGKVNITDYLPSFDVCVLSSISEGQPLAVLEGMAAAIPWVVTDVGCCAELIKGHHSSEQAGFVVPPVNPRKMAEKLKWFYRNQEKATIFGLNGQKRVKEFYQIDQMIYEYSKLYQERGQEIGRNRISPPGVV
ncbi:GT4 family glycosyltransferase PelF [Metabacillus endolithicus]|uniref:GT4 family glycosyltransferase PelF n=1 Tax=Metabacillus endolithicus TaxID=1535204 RepID=A0ABW5BVQ3_9BACI